MHGAVPFAAGVLGVLLGFTQAPPVVGDCVASAVVTAACSGREYWGHVPGGGCAGGGTQHDRGPRCRASTPCAFPGSAAAATDAPAAGARPAAAVQEARTTPRPPRGPPAHTPITVMPPLCTPRRRPPCRAAASCLPCSRASGSTRRTRRCARECHCANAWRASCACRQPHAPPRLRPAPSSQLARPQGRSRQ